MSKKITIRQCEDLMVNPRPIVRSYSKFTEFLTINLSPSSYKNEAGERRIRCTTLAIAHEGRMTAQTLLQTIYQQGLFDSLDAAFIKELVVVYRISDYHTLAAYLIGARYSYAEELCAHRKALLGDTTDLEQVTAFAERCKALAKPAFKIEEP